MEKLQIIKELRNQKAMEDEHKAESDNAFDLEALLEENYAEYYDEYEQNTGVIGMKTIRHIR